MRRALACAASLWATSVLAAGSPGALLNLSYRIDVRVVHAPAQPARDVASIALPARLEELLPKPEPVLATAPPAVLVVFARSYDDVWERIRDGAAIGDIDSPLVKRWQAWYLARPQILKGITERSRPYLFHVVEELAARGMPLELALLPMVESGYDANALSSANAAGLWQFIPETGRRYGLMQSSDYDARRDVVAATGAALDYLKFLYDLFGDWPLALAAYNWGENAVGAAIERNRAKGLGGNYAALTLPEETRNYVPKLLALKQLLLNTPEVRAEREPVPNRPYFAVLEKPRNLDLQSAAKLADTPLQGFLMLNAAHSPTAAPGSAAGKGTAQASVLVPVEKAELFKANLERHNNSAALPAKAGKTPAVKDAPPVVADNRKAIQANKSAYKGAPIVHQVARGETLVSIARRYGITEALIKDWNPLVEAGLDIGQKLFLHTN